MSAAKPKIAVFAGPTATILNTPDLVTSQSLRPQRIAAPVTVYVEAFTAHPLEGDRASLYSPPDGWLDQNGAFSEQRPDSAEAKPVYVARLHPDDGLFLLPYTARQADGRSWEETCAHPYAAPEFARQTFYPDARRLYEEIERFGIDDYGRPVALGSLADFEFFRAAPSGGQTSDQPGADYFVYYPYHLQSEPSLSHLAQITNQIQEVLVSGEYAGAQWLEGSPTIEETLYWLGLLVDTTVPIIGHAAQRRHQSLSADGDRNIVDGVKFIASGVALDDEGRNRVGACLIVDELVYAARDVTKVDARPGGYRTTGGHGGIVADMGGYAPPQLTYVPCRRHTHTSELRLSTLPAAVAGVFRAAGSDETIAVTEVRTKNRDGLVPSAIPVVTISTYARYSQSSGKDDEHLRRDHVDLAARIADNLERAPLSGFVCEGMSPFAMSHPSHNAALKEAIFSGQPVARVGRGRTEGMAYKSDPVFIAANNLTATKARMLLMAALLKWGALPPARDPRNPTPHEVEVTTRAVARYQRLFDTH